MESKWSVSKVSSKIMHWGFYSVRITMNGQKRQTQKIGLFIPIRLWCLHSVWKSPKKYHSKLRAKRATFTFGVDKSWFKMPKMANLWKPEDYGQTVVPDRLSFNKTKISGKCQNWKIKMRIFKQKIQNEWDFLTFFANIVD